MFVVGTLVVATAAWFYPHRDAVAALTVGAIPVAVSLAKALEVGLVWEPFVAFCLLVAAAAIPACVSILWWPLRKLSYEERRDVLRQVLELPYDERMRIFWSRRYDQLRPKG